MPAAQPMKECVRYAAVAAAAYSIAGWLFIKDGSFTETWILYAGNFLFAAVTAIFIILFSRKYKYSSVAQMMRAAFITVAAGIVISTIICLLMLLLLHPGLFGRHNAVELKRAPVQFAGKNKGFVIILLVDAVLGNICTGFFVSMLFPFMLASKKEDTGTQ